MNGLKIMKLLALIMHVDKIVKINEDEQNALLRAFSRLIVSEKVEVMVNHRKLLHKFKQVNSETSLSILSYSSLIIAVQLYMTNQDKLDKLNISDLTLDQIRDITSKKAKIFLKKQFRKQKKREKLLSYWAIVRTLKNNENYGFRSIELYLKKEHKFQVSYSTIAKLWKQMENKKERENG